MEPCMMTFCNCSKLSQCLSLSKGLTLKGHSQLWHRAHLDTIPSLWIKFTPTWTQSSGDARYTKSIYALLSRSILWSLLCYCVRNRDHCCVLCDIARDLLLTWYIVHQPKVHLEICFNFTVSCLILNRLLKNLFLSVILFILWLCFYHTWLKTVWTTSLLHAN